jgi:hypothetical protein
MSEVIKPPWQGEFTFRQLRTYPNSRVRAVAEHLMRRPFNYIPDDMMTAPMVSRLCDFVDGSQGGRYNASRIREGTNSFVSVMQQARGNFLLPARHWALLVAHGPGRLTLDLHHTGGPQVR